MAHLGAHADWSYLIASQCILEFFVLTACIRFGLFAEEDVVIRGIGEIHLKLDDFDVYQAQCYRNEDRQTIFSLIDSSGGGGTGFNQAMQRYSSRGTHFAPSELIEEFSDRRDARVRQHVVVVPGDHDAHGALAEDDPRIPVPEVDLPVALAQHEAVPHAGDGRAGGLQAFRVGFGSSQGAGVTELV